MDILKVIMHSSFVKYESVPEHQTAKRISGQILSQWFVRVFLMVAIDRHVLYCLWLGVYFFYSNLYV